MNMYIYIDVHPFEHVEIVDSVVECPSCRRSLDELLRGSICDPTRVTTFGAEAKEQRFFTAGKSGRWLVDGWLMVGSWVQW
jgi:hypothetical protein